MSLFDRIKGKTLELEEQEKERELQKELERKEQERLLKEAEERRKQLEEIEKAGEKEQLDVAEAVRQAEEKEQQEAEILPIRQKIKELQTSMSQLQLIKNSMQDQHVADSDGAYTAEGMKTYAVKTGQKWSTKKQELEKLFTTDKKALDSMGIKSFDQLVGAEDFQEEPEIKDYKQADKEVIHLLGADEALVHRLGDLKVVLPENQLFSYEAVTRAIDAKIETLKNELVAENLKTPEGKAEAVKAKVEKFANSIPSIEFKRIPNPKAGAPTAELLLFPKDSVRHVPIELSPKGVNFNNWENTRLLPPEFATIETEVGFSVARAVVQKAYEDKIDKAFKHFDSMNDQLGIAPEILAKADPEKAKGAQKAFDQFNTMYGREAFKQEVENKKKAIEDKGINTLGRYLGDTKNELAGISNEKDLLEAFRDTNRFPPLYEWESLQKKIEKRIELNKRFLESFDAVSNQEEFNNFIEVTVEAIMKEYRNNDSFSPYRDDYDEMKVSFQKIIGVKYGNGALENIKKQGENYYDIKRSVAEKQKNLDEQKDLVSESLSNVLEAKLLQYEMAKVLKENGFKNSVNEELRSIENNRKEGIAILSELTKIEQGLPENEELRLTGDYLVRPDIEKQISEHKAKIPGKEKELANAQAVLDGEGSRPKVFGREAWDIDHNRRVLDRDTLSTQLFEMKNTELNELNRKRLISTSGLKNYVAWGSYSDLIKNQNVTGTKETIFTALRSGVEVIMNKKLPEEVIKLQEKYTELEKIINKK